MYDVAIVTNNSHQPRFTPAFNKGNGTEQKNLYSFERGLQ